MGQPSMGRGFSGTAIFGCPSHSCDFADAHRLSTCGDELENPAYAFGKLVFSRDQAENQISVCREIKKVPRMNVDIFLCQKLNSDFFVALCCRHAQNRIPPALHLEPAASLLPGKLPANSRRFAPTATGPL